MAPVPKASKTKRGRGTTKKKLSAFNKFMQSEMKRLKIEQPDMQHKDRFKLAALNWKTSQKNPKAS